MECMQMCGGAREVYQDKCCMWSVVMKFINRVEEMCAQDASTRTFGLKGWVA